MQNAPRRSRARLLPLVGLAATAASYFVATTPGDRSRRPPELTGSVWRVSHAGTTQIAYVTREERERKEPEVTRRSITYRPYVRFQLELRRVGDGSLARREHLGDVEGSTVPDVPEIVGVAGDVLWLWRDSLEGRALPDLSIRHTPGRLSYSAGTSRDALPDRAKGFVLAPDSTTAAGVVLVARARDARFYRIDAASGAVAPLDPQLLPRNTSSSRVEDRFDFIYPEARAAGITDFSSRMNRSFATPTGLWYSLLSESDRQTLGRWPSGTDRPYGPVARSLYRAPYTLDDRGRAELDLAKLEPVGSERLIQSGFLFRTWGRIWDVPDPSSSLVMAKARLGDDEPWEVLRLTRDGRVLWRTSTGLVTSLAVLNLESHVLFVGLPLGDAKRASGARASEQIVWIDQVTGKRRTVTVESGAVE